MITDNSTGDHFIFFNGNKHGRMRFMTIATTCLNQSCKEFTLHAYLHSLSPGTPGRSEKVTLVEDWRLRPTSAEKPMPDYIPSPILEDYREACAIVSLSPKASATLSRRCLQGMIRDFWNISGRTLHEEINKLEDKINPATFDAINAIKKIGNIGAHMERDINVVVDVDPQEASLLIDMIEMLIKDWYVERHDREQRIARLLEMSKIKQEARKTTESPSSPALPPPDTAG
ncbi:MULTISPECIES: DUF4145 domain-containing protein [unclassified Xanthomonas]|uniref:DUF4145 domain-containing protein n=1 Tax=unclassified Xanthomonas TaxID=2643310 RepID=UPI002882ED97|nr:MULTISPECIES: DUF4145 domain-containing protein [unclassified Xanthomonas]